MISEQEAREAAARLKNGGGDAFACWEDYQESSQKDEDVEVAANWICQELARREAERAERAKPIDAEWLESIGAYHEWNHGGDAGWYGIEIDDDEWLSVSGATGFTHIVMGDGVKQIERRFDTRGQLLDLLAALRGTERPA